MRELWELYITFASIGACTFGGGLTMLPLLQAEVVDKKKWATDAELMDYYAIGQCTPGIIAINTSTFVGYKRKGIKGGIVATLGMITPSLIIITIIASFLTAFSEQPLVQNAFAAIRVAVAVLVLNTVIKMWGSNVKNKTGAVIAIAAMLSSFLFKISPIAIVLVGGSLGIVIPRLKKGGSD